MTSGLMAVYALKERPATCWTLLFGVVAATVPDIDIVYGKSALEYLAVHRGITHSFVGGAGVAGIVALLFAYPLRRAEHGWSFFRVWLMAYLLILLHIWLDSITTYGTKILLPFSDWRIRLPGVYIIDLLLTLPLVFVTVYALREWYQKRITYCGQYTSSPRLRHMARIVLGWVIVYPLCNMGIAWMLEQHWSARFASPDGTPAHVRVIPEAMTPFVWKLVISDDDAWRMARINVTDWGDALPKTMRYPKAEEQEWNALRDQHPLFHEYDRFSMFLAQAKASTPFERVYHDLRFTTVFPAIHELVGRNLEDGGVFQLKARIDSKGKLEAYHFQGGISGEDVAQWVPTRPSTMPPTVP